LPALQQPVPAISQNLPEGVANLPRVFERLRRQAWDGPSVTEFVEKITDRCFKTLDISGRHL
jgi:hypothetical protein